MAIEAIQPTNTQQRRSVFIPIAQGAALGSVSGFAAKYILPVTPEEKLSNEYINVTREINEQKLRFNARVKSYIDSIASKENKTFAEDQFVKMFDGMKNGDKVSKKSKECAINNIKKQHPEQYKEFKNICKAYSNLTDKNAKKLLSAYDLITKHIRPTSFFLITGAIVGASIGMINNILKTDVKQ